MSVDRAGWTFLREIFVAVSQYMAKRLPGHDLRTTACTSGYASNLLWKEGKEEEKKKIRQQEKEERRKERQEKREKEERRKIRRRESIGIFK
jgi:hypothetical protein